MKNYNAALTVKSRNTKTGPIPVSTTSHATCPSACQFSKAATGDAAGICYAEHGPLAMFWQKVTEKRAGNAWEIFVKEIDALPQGQFWRHNQAGDLPGNTEFIDAAALAKLVKANEGKQGFTYTHYDVSKKKNADAVKAANAAGFRINLSADTLAHADTLLATNAGPVVVVLPEDTKPDADLFTPAGVRVVVCPATYRDDITCGGGKVRDGKVTRVTKACGLCARNRSTVVGFPAHGQGKKKADTITRV